MQIRWFDVWAGQFIHPDVRPSKFEFSSTMRTGKIQYFLYFNYADMIKMIWDTIVMDGGVWRLKKLWTFRGWTFTVKRDPEKHTMRKLNAYWFNADCLNLIYKANKDAVILVIQKNMLSELKISVQKALEVWTYLSFNGELQLFIPKDKFDKVY